MFRYRWILVLILALVGGALSGCGEDGDYIEVVGGGFLYNYRIAEATCEIVAKPLRAAPEEASLEARFQNPDGGEELVVRKKVFPAERRYAVVSPPLAGIKAGHEYKVSLLLLDADGKTLETHEKNFKAKIDRSALPEKPLTIGPGYVKNP
ncbi:hypothetical protein [Breoghania sp.]|uniref:hypothetical protein n=1 Tax=Breoghania sp. TaxID=2065378 RepID=UPI0026396F1B|nr:hypothetical protein [Breoghania sp.]MDJ0931896.1 hypothetical protein [Breoghania sp.]